MKKKIMILGATYSQVPLIKTAREMGHTAIVVSTPGKYIGFDYADEKCFADITKPEEVLKVAQEYQIDGIATCCIDTGVRSIGYVCEQLGLCGLSEKSANMSANKLLMKTAFVQGNVNTAKYFEIRDEKELSRVLENLKFPVIVKAVDLQGSRGIYIAHTKEEALNGFNKTMSESKENFCIIEEFIEGLEFGAQAFVYNGEVLFVLPHGDNTYLSGTNVPIGHYAPFIAAEGVLERAKMQVELAIKAIGLDNCAVNVDLILKDNEIYVIELTGRAGATALPELVSIYFGIDYYKMIAMTALQEDPKKIFESRKTVCTPNASRMLLSEKSGMVKNINNRNILDENIYEILLNINLGDSIKKFTTASDSYGRVIVKGIDNDECKEKIEEVISNIEIDLE